MKVSANFQIKELVHPEFIADHGEAKMVRVIKRYAPYMLLGLEQLKSFVGGDSIIVNDYVFGGHYINSGLRHPLYPLKNSSLLSAHYYMKATDCKFKNRNIAELQESILENPHLHPYIERMENARYTKTWLHVQWGYRIPNNSIQIFKP